MTWAALYTGSAGGLCEIYLDWTQARGAVDRFITQIDPPRTAVTFQALLKEARPEQPWHAFDELNQFAIEIV